MIDVNLCGHELADSTEQKTEPESRKTCVMAMPCAMHPPLHVLSNQLFGHLTFEIGTNSDPSREKRDPAKIQRKHNV